VSPKVTVSSNKAAYRLLCSKPGQTTSITATAAVTPQKLAVTCGTTPPAFTFSGDITAAKAGSVSYYWALSDGTTSPAQTLFFSAPETLAVTPFTVKAPADTANATAELVVTSPTPAVSNSAGYTLTCTPKAPVYSTLKFLSTALPGGTVGKAYSATVQATGGNDHYTWSATGLPSGLGINPGTGLISGTPKVGGTASVTVSVHDSEAAGSKHSKTAAAKDRAATGPQVASRTFSLAVSNGKSPTLKIATASLPGGTAGSHYSASVAATGGNGHYHWTATGLAAGLGINAGTGVISGTPKVGGIDSVKVTVTDTESPAQRASATFTVTFKTLYPALKITTTALPGGTANTAYTAALAAAGGNGHYAWTATGLPAGLQIAPGSNQITGTPTAASSGPVTVTVTDTEMPAAQQTSATFTLSVVYPQLQNTTDGLAAGTVGASYTAPLSASGGNGSYTWTVTGLPAGLGLNPGANMITGTPTQAGSFQVTINVADTETPPQTASAVTLTLAVGYPPVQITTATLAAGTAGASYATPLSASGGNGHYTWAATGLPKGLSIVAHGSEEIIGTPATTGSFQVSVTATDTEASPQTATKTLTLTISYPPLQNTTASLPTAILYNSYSAPLTASGGSGKYAWTASGLPTGLAVTVDASGATAITGAPGEGTSVTKPYSVAIKVTDTVTGASLPFTLLLTVDPQPLV
jgi:hypothetical protein